MASLLSSIRTIWAGKSELTSLVSVARVFTGRVPSTRQIAMPYVTVLAAGGYTTHRTDKTRYYQVPVTFHIWADAEVANALENALTLARAIGDAYVDTCWTLTATDKVIDCLDEGEPLVNQVKLPTHHIWEVVQMVTVCLERSRVDENTCCQ